MIDSTGNRPTSAHCGWSVVVSLQDEMVRCGLGTMLSSLQHIDAVTTSGDADQTIELLRSRRFDAVILPYDMAEDSARRVTEEASRHGAKVILLLDRADAESAAQAATTIPSDGFLIKDELTSESLKDVLSRLSDGEMPMPPKLARMLLSHVRSANSRHRVRPIMLTPREHQALTLLAQGLSNKQIARRLGISEHGAKRHVANVLAKLNCPNRTLAVVTAMKEGLIQEAGTHP